MVVEPDLAYRHGAGKGRRAPDPLGRLRREALRLVRMHARREMDEVVPRRQRRAGLGVADERRDGDQPDDAGRPGACDHLASIGLEVLQCQVGVAVAEQVEAPAYFTFQPGATGSSVVRMYG